MIEKDKRLGCFVRPNGDMLRFYCRAGKKIFAVEIATEEFGEDGLKAHSLCPFWTDEEPFFERNQDLRPISEKEFCDRVLGDMQTWFRTIYVTFDGRQ